MAVKFEQFQKWHPDQGTFGTGQSEEARGVIRTATGYRPFPGLVDTNVDTLPGTDAAIPTGLMLGRTVTGDAQTFVALFDSPVLPLQQLQTDGSWAPGSGFDVLTDTRFQSVQWEDVLYVTNFNGLDTGGLWQQQLGAAGSFTAVDYTSTQQPTPPAGLEVQLQPKFVAIVRDFLVVGNMLDPSDGGTWDRGGLHPDRVRWSGINQPNLMSLEGDAAVLSDFQDLPDAGEVRGVVGGEYGVVLCENGIFRMDFIGPPAIFSFNRIERARGCIEPNSVVVANNIVYYLSDDGWKSFDGQNIQPLGAERFDRWFNVTATQSSLPTMTTFVDPNNQLILWGFNSTFNNRDVNDAILIYNYAINEASYDYLDHSILGAFVVPGQDIESVDIRLAEGTLETDTELTKWGAASSYTVTDDPSVGDKNSIVTYRPEITLGSDWQGAWATSTAYTVDQYVYIPDGVTTNREDVFKCIANHTSDAAVDTDVNRPHTGIDYDTVWEQVASPTRVYRAQNAVTGNAANLPPPLDDTNWTRDDTITASIERMETTPWDDISFKPGAQIFGAISRKTVENEDRLHVFSGYPDSAVIETAEMRPGPGRSRMRSVQLAVEAASGAVAPSVTIQDLTRNRLGVPSTISRSISIAPGETYRMNEDARYHKLRITLMGPWSDATGLFHDTTPTGDR